MHAWKYTHTHRFRDYVYSIDIFLFYFVGITALRGYYLQSFPLLSRNWLEYEKGESDEREYIYVQVVRVLHPSV